MCFVVNGFVDIAKKVANKSHIKAIFATLYRFTLRRK